jgi:hypothetical protein
MKRLLGVLSALSLFCLSGALAAQESGWRLGAAQGERLYYRIRWLGVPSADASLQLEQGKGYKITAKLATTGAARMLKTINETLSADGEHRDGAFIGRHFVKDQQRGDQTRWTSYLFDREMRQVLRRHRPQEGKPEERLVIAVENEQINDPLSAVYAVRAWPELLLGRTLQRTVVDGEKAFCLTVTVGGSETWQGELGAFRAFALQVVVENSETLRQRGPMQLLVTDDARRIPLQIEAQLAIGAVVAELIGYDDGRGEIRRLPE